MNTIPSTELLKNPAGAIYHLGLMPEDIADNIILVGDPGRVPLVSAHFDSIELKKQNREMITHTGYRNGKRITVISTGMGTDNIEIVVTELDALVNIDLSTMTIKPEHHSLNLVRIGTSGALNPEIKPGFPVASSYGFGIDGILQFYDFKEYNRENVVEEFVKHTQWGEDLPYPYCVQCSEKLMQQIAYDMVKGVTVTAPGFFAPQGRQIRCQLKYPDLNQKIESFEYKGLHMTNMEMECSALYGLSKVYGHQALTCCLILANRVTGEFYENYKPKMEELVETIVTRL